MRGTAMVFPVTASLFLGFWSIVSAQEAEGQRPAHYKKWRENPKMVVFGDSVSDAGGRNFNAPASFDFEGIGPYPWTRLFDAPDSNSSFRAYLPAPGSPTNGRIWPEWLRVPDDFNFATSSGTATEVFRSFEICGGYTGEGEEFPTGTLDEQVTRYFNDVLDQTDETLDYAHIIVIGGNDITAVLSAASRYAIGGDGYVDPVAFENVFEIVDGIPVFTFEPFIREVVGAWQEAITRLIERGVTGRIVLSNMLSFKGFPGVAESGFADVLDQVAVATNNAAQLTFAATPQVRFLDVYSLTAAIVDQPELYESLGFTRGSEPSVSEPCLGLGFVVDTNAEIMGTQADRAAGCRGQCDLCADRTSPCQNCYQGNPSATVCAEPEKYIFWDSLHFTTAVHQFIAEAMRQCAKDSPNYDRAFVEVLCPQGA